MLEIEEHIRNLYGVILAGGAGTRLWPLSRELLPKQLLRFFGMESLLRQSVARLTQLIPEEKVVIVSSEHLQKEIQNHLLSEKPLFEKVNYVIEPAPKNTAPAVLLAARELFKKDPEAILGVFPSDHYIENDKELLEAVKIAYEVAKRGYLVTFGLKPSSPETGFGYIKAGASLNFESRVFKAVHFVEKPDLETAISLVSSGRYFWNSGMFVFKAKTILEEAEKHLSDVVLALKKIDTLGKKNSLVVAEIFSQIEPISIDYGIMEKSEHVAVIPIEVGWKDVGSLSALEEFFEKDINGNAVYGNVVEMESKGSIFYSESRLIAGIGLKDMMVIDTRDATLVCPKSRAQDVAKIVARLKEKNADECLMHRYSERPWGSFVLLDKGENYQVKMIEVLPGKRTSEQMHNYRSEHWVIVRGTAKVTIDGVERTVKENENVFIPLRSRHRLENPGETPLQLIEVQYGEYLSENDIVRFVDDYGRVTE